MRARQIEIFETGEVFNSIAELCTELGLQYQTGLGSYIDKRPWYGLHFCSIPNDVPVCIHCNVKLDDNNRYAHTQKKESGYWICKNCLRAKARDNQLKLKKKDWIAYRYKRFRNTYGGTITEQQLKKLHQVQNGCCLFCKDKLTFELELDHITPISKGGQSVISNLQFLCEMCNRGKWNRSSKEYIEHCKKVAKNIDTTTEDKT